MDYHIEPVAMFDKVLEPRIEQSLQSMPNSRATEKED